MVVLLTGGTGFIGGHVLRALLDAGHTVRVAARRPGGDIPGVTWVRGDFSRDVTPASWRDAVAGVDAVVNCVGIIREVPGQRFVDLHERAPVALFSAAAAAGVRRLVNLSALGADTGMEPYFATRRVADDKVLALGGVVLRPSFVWGPGDLSMRFFRMLAALPVVPVVGDGLYPVQPIHVQDVTRAIVAAVNGDFTGAFDLGGAGQITFGDLLGALRRRMGRGPGLRWHVPLGLVRFGAALTSRTGLGPITPDELAMLLRGSTCDLSAFVARFGFTPRGFRAGLATEAGAAREALVADLDLLAPVLRITVAFIWIATPIATWFMWPRADSIALAVGAGVPPALAGPSVDIACAFELVIAAAILAGWRMREVGIVQILLVGTYTAILLFSGSPLWGHPFGPLTKNVPLIGAILALMATRDRGTR